MAMKRAFVEFCEQQNACQMVLKKDLSLEHLEFLNDPGLIQYYFNVAKRIKSQPMFVYNNDAIFKFALLGKSTFTVPDHKRKSMRMGCNVYNFGESAIGKTQALSYFKDDIHPLFVQKAISFLEINNIVDYNRDWLNFYFTANRKKRAFEEIRKREGSGIFYFNEGKAGLSDLAKGGPQDANNVLLAIGDPFIDPMNFSNDYLSMNGIRNNRSVFLGNFVITGYADLLRNSEEGILGRGFGPIVEEIDFSLYERMYQEYETEDELEAERNFQIWRYFNFELLDGIWTVRAEPINFKCRESAINKYETKYLMHNASLDDITYPENWLNDMGEVRLDLRTGEDGFSKVDTYFRLLQKNTIHTVKRGVLRRLMRVDFNFGLYNKIVKRSLSISNVNQQIDFTDIDILTYEDIAGPSFDMCSKYYEQIAIFINKIGISYGNQKASANQLTKNQKLLQKLLIFNSGCFNTQQFQTSTGRSSKVSDIQNAMKFLESLSIVRTYTTKAPNHRIVMFMKKIPSCFWNDVHKETTTSLLRSLNLDIMEFDTTCDMNVFQREQKANVYTNNLLDQYDWELQQQI